LFVSGDFRGILGHPPYSGSSAAIAKSGLRQVIPFLKGVTEHGVVCPDRR
jgi:hypothetical protein